MQPLAKKTVRGREYAWLDVATGFRNGIASWPSRRHRAKPGPTLGIVTTVHGDETMALMAVRSCRCRTRRVSDALPQFRSRTRWRLGVQRARREQKGNRLARGLFPAIRRQSHATDGSVITTQLRDYVDALSISIAGARPAAKPGRSRCPARRRYQALELCRASRCSSMPTICRHRRSLLQLRHSHRQPGDRRVYLTPRGGRLSKRPWPDCAPSASLGMISMSRSRPKAALFASRAASGQPSFGGFLQSTSPPPRISGRTRGEKLPRGGRSAQPRGDQELAHPSPASVLSPHSGTVDAGTKASRSPRKRRPHGSERGAAVPPAANDDVAAVLDGGGGGMARCARRIGRHGARATARQPIPFGHKLAVHDIAQGKLSPRGFRSGPLRRRSQGEHVHSHNMQRSRCLSRSAD